MEPEMPAIRRIHYSTSALPLLIGLGMLAAASAAFASVTVAPATR
jgi:hypothetical protein